MTYSDEIVTEPDQLFWFGQWAFRSLPVGGSRLARENRRVLAEGNAPRGADEASFTRGCCVEDEEEEGDEERT